MLRHARHTARGRGRAVSHSGARWHSTSGAASGRRVVVTGMGVVSPLGVGLAHMWPRLIKGECAVRNIASVLGISPATATATATKGAAPPTLSDADRKTLASSPYPYATELAAVLPQLPCKVAAFVPRGSGPGELDIEKMVDRSIRSATSPFIHFAVVAANEALAQARWGSAGGGAALTEEQRDRTGVAIGSGIGSVEESYTSGAILNGAGGLRRVSPYGIPKLLINLAAGHVSMAHGFRGPNHAVSTACATGANAMGDAARLIEYGDADVMIAGSSEAAVTPVSLALFSRCKALATAYNDRPEHASRPFAADRDGFVMGEGAGVLVLEEREHALRRGAAVLGEVVGYGLSGDAHHVTAPDPNGAGALRCMRASLGHARLLRPDGTRTADPSSVSYVNAHATSTPAGDGAELRALSALFGGAEHAKRVAISSTKGAIGHLLGGAGAVEAIIALNTLRTGQLPPTLNLTAPDAEFAEWNLLRSGGTIDTSAPRYALSNSFGFGGVNASLVFRCD